jgi:hypothetical protein
MEIISDTAQCDICSMIAFKTLDLCLQLISIKANWVCKSAENIFLNSLWSTQLYYCNTLVSEQIYVHF